MDQFEEIFRFGLDGETSERSDEAADFVSLMLGLAEQREIPAYVTMMMRSDFLGDCTEFPNLAETINEGMYLIPRMSREQRRLAIVSCSQPLKTLTQTTPLQSQRTCTRRVASAAATDL